MNKILHIVLLVIFVLAIILVPFQTEHVNAAKDKELVLLDSDMQELFDDGIAMMMLATEPNVKLLGVTITTGNDWIEYGTAYTIRQLEALNIKNVPIAMGTTPSSIRTRLGHLDEEFKKYGRGFDMHIGAAAHAKPADWRAAYASLYKSTPTLKPIDESAVDFIIRTIKKHPNQVTIVEIGPQTNLAAAIKKAPEIVPLIKRVVYMAGAFFTSGNVTPAAEFNIWFDPVSAKKIIRTPFKEQIFFPLDACETVRLNKETFSNLKAKVKSPILKDMIAHAEATDSIFQGSDTRLIWDILAAAFVIDPSIVKEEIQMPVDVNDVLSPSYGETLAYRVAPQGAQKAHIITIVDNDKVISLLYSLFDKL